MFTTAAAGTAAAATAASTAAAGTAAAATASVAAAASAAAASAATAAGTGIFTMSNAMMAASALSALGGVYGSIQSARQQKAQASYQAEVARQNTELSEQQASAARREGYESMVEQRQKTARLISAQRAAGGASGTAVDAGSNLDVQSDTAAQGEIDALKAYQKGLDKAYGYDIQANNYTNHASAYDASARSAGKTGVFNALNSVVGGIADMGTTWSKYAAVSSSRTGTVHGGSSLQYVKKTVSRMGG